VLGVLLNPPAFLPSLTLLPPDPEFLLYSHYILRPPSVPVVLEALPPGGDVLGDCEGCTDTTRGEGGRVSGEEGI